MIEGFVDSASAYEVVLALARESPRDSYQMEWQQALDVTATLIGANHFRLSPSPKAEGGASGPYGTLVLGLENAVSRINPDGPPKSAINKTRRWANRNIGKVQRIVGSFTAPDGSAFSHNAANWLESHIRNVWREQLIRHGALFDQVFIPQLARIVDISSDDMQKMWDESTDPFVVNRLVDKRPNSDSFRIIRDSFIASTLLRGRYHEYIAQESGVQILSHPIRDTVSLKNLSNQSFTIESSNTERYLANIVLAGSFAERNHNARVALWAENVSVLRKVQDQISLGPKALDETARDVALDAAKRFGVRVHSRRLEQALDFGVGLGSSVLTSFVLSRWPSFAVGVGVAAMSTKLQLGRSSAKLLSATHWSLRKLSQAAPGHLGRASSASTTT